MNKANTAKSPKKRLDVAIAVFCVLIAFFMWIYVMLVESPEYQETFNNITVDLTNTALIEDKSLVIYNGYGTTVDITLSGKKSVISGLTEADIVATADVGSIADESGRYTCKISVDVPTGCQLVRMSQESVSVYIDKAASDSVSLIERISNVNLPEGCFVGELEFPFNKITVTGTEIALQTIDRAVVEIDMTGVRKTTEMTRSVYLIDKKGERIDSPYIDYYPKEVKVKIPIMKTVAVDLKTYFKHDFLDFANTDVVITPERVEVTGDAAIINQGGLIEAIEIDEKTEFTGNRANKIVELEFVDGVELSSSKAEVTAIIDSAYTVKEVAVPSTSIIASGVNPGVYYQIEKSDKVIRLLGREDILDDIDGEDITLILDMSPYSGGRTGFVTVRAIVNFRSGLRGKILEVGTYSVNVRLYDAPIETDPPETEPKDTDTTATE